MPPFWYSAISIPQGSTTADVKAKIISSSIRKLGELEAVSDSILANLTKYDLEKMGRVIDDLMPGPDLTLEVNCPNCDADIRQQLDWSYDFFFGSASL